MFAATLRSLKKGCRFPSSTWLEEQGTPIDGAVGSRRNRSGRGGGGGGGREQSDSGGGGYGGGGDFSLILEVETEVLKSHCF